MHKERNIYISIIQGPRSSIKFCFLSIQNMYIQMKSKTLEQRLHLMICYDSIYKCPGDGFHWFTRTCANVHHTSLQSFMHKLIGWKEDALPNAYKMISYFNLYYFALNMLYYNLYLCISTLFLQLYTVI